MKLSTHDKNWIILLLTNEIYARSIVGDLKKLYETAPEAKRTDYKKLLRQYNLIWKQLVKTNDRFQDEIAKLYPADDVYHIHDTAMVIIEMMEQGLSYAQLKRLAKSVGINTEQYVTNYIQ